MLFARIVDDILARQPTCSVIDVGGTGAFWRAFGSRLDWNRVTVTLLNRDPSVDAVANLPFIEGDARDMAVIADHAFDVAFSSSLIEHVGLWPDMQAAAREIIRVASRYFIQTPYYWFPLETHSRLPFFHWLPEPLKRRIVMARPCGFLPRATTVDEACRLVQGIQLLDRTQMQALFPCAQVSFEYAFGLPKAIIAMKRC